MASAILGSKGSAHMIIETKDKTTVKLTIGGSITSAANTYTTEVTGDRRTQLLNAMKNHAYRKDNRSIEIFTMDMKNETLNKSEKKTLYFASDEFGRLRIHIGEDTFFATASPSQLCQAILMMLQM